MCFSFFLEMTFFPLEIVTNRLLFSIGESCFFSPRDFHLCKFRWSPSLRGAADVGQYSDFIEGLGPGQLVGRQVLGASSLGDIQLSMCHQKGCLEVEVIRARGLQVWMATLNERSIPFLSKCFNQNFFQFGFNSCGQAQKYFQRLM